MKLKLLNPVYVTVFTIINGVLITSRINKIHSRRCNVITNETLNEYIKILT